MSRSVLITLLVLGLGLSIQFRRHYDNAIPPAEMAQVVLIPLALAIGFITPLRDGAMRIVHRLRTPSPRAVPIIAIAVGVISFVYLLASAHLHDRDLSPRMQDEFSYVIQSQLLVHGRLWLPQPALADFFETFHVISKPVYASVYFPGTALLYVPGVWLGLPHYFTSLAICAICVALTYLLALTLLDGAFALLAAIMLLTTSLFFFRSTLALSNVPAMMFALIVLLTWLKFDRSRQVRWLIVVGLAGGWGLNSRPVDLFAYLLPLAALTLLKLRTPRKIFLALLAIILPALPFAGLQLVFNKGVTGKWFTTPYRFYFDEFQPQTKIGFVKDDPNIRPHTQLKQKLDLYEEFLRPLIRENQPENIWTLLARWRLKFIVGATMPAYLLLTLLPIGLVGAARNRVMCTICIIVPIVWLAIYTPYPYFMPYYPLAIAPPIVLLLLLGAREIVRAFNSHSSAVVLSMMLILSLCIAAIPEVRLDFEEEKYAAIPGLNGLNQALQDRIQPPAVVLFKYDPPASWHSEPVYNYTVADPMDAPVIRANDLGPARNREIISYFAQHRPQTMFYRFNRGTEMMEKLGTAEQLESAKPTTAR